MPRVLPAPAPLAPEAAQVLRQFRIVFNAVRRHFRTTERKAGLSGAHVWALSVIGEEAGIGVNGLAQAMDVHQSTASNLVRGLLADAYVTAQKDPEDRRLVRLALTAEGRKALRAAPHPYAGVLPDALGRLDVKTLRRLQRDLAALIDVLDPEGQGAQRPLGARED